MAKVKHKEVPIEFETLVARQKRFDELMRTLVAEGICEPGPRDGHKVVCPGCLRDTPVSFTLTPQQLACQAEQRDGKLGCGEPFELRAACPLHHLDWFPLDPTPQCLVPSWHRDVMPDHPARARYRELKLQFLQDIGVAK